MRYLRSMNYTLAILALLMVFRMAEARKVVYSPWVTPGEIELAYYIDGFENSAGKFVHNQEVEVEYGLGRKDKLAFYGIYGDRPAASSARAWRVEWIHTLSSGRSDSGLAFYFEYQQRLQQVDTVEFKPLYETSILDSAIRLRLNFEFETEIGSGAAHGIELGYAASIAPKGKRRITPALEFYGTVGRIDNISSSDDQLHLAGPVVDILLIKDLKLQLGALLGLTSGSEDWRLKSQLSLEWD